MTPTRRDLTLSAAAAALLGPEAMAQGRGRSQVGRYPAPVYIPSPPGTAWFAPRIPAYPQPNVTNQQLIDDARRLSDALEGHIRA